VIDWLQNGGGVELDMGEDWSQSSGDLVEGWLYQNGCTVVAARVAIESVVFTDCGVCTAIGIKSSWHQKR